MSPETEMDWSQCEVKEAPVVTLPELPEDAEPATAEQLLAVYEDAIAHMPTINNYTLQAYADAVETIKLSEKRMEAKRKALVGPINKQVDEINEAYNPWIKRFGLLWRRVSEIPNKYIAEQKRAAELEQAKRNAEAAARQAELDRKADEARQAAAKAAESGDAVAAVKLEEKANQLEQKAAEVVPQAVDQVSNKVETGTSTVSFGGGKKVWNLPGWDKKKPLHCLDSCLAPLVGDLTKLPPGVQFLLRMSQVNPVFLNAAYKAKEKFPKPFGEETDYSGSTLRS